MTKNLNSLTKAQLIAQNPGLGLTNSMLKADIVKTIENQPVKEKTDTQKFLQNEH